MQKKNQQNLLSIYVHSSTLQTKQHANCYFFVPTIMHFVIDLNFFDYLNGTLESIYRHLMLLSCCCVEEESDREKNFARKEE
jgi:hypothetical protein